MNAESSCDKPLLAEEYPPLAGAVTEVRRTVRTMLTQWQVPGPAAEDILLVVEELLANVIDHAQTPFRITVDRRGSTVQVAVRDRSCAPPRMREVDLTALRGRGLRLVAAIAQRWGYDGEDTGKTVWAEVAV
ncbi:ATP-binding protein [Cryptosporangium aurantiacum]|uniref:Anti-sigma regulatory factor (Ser/Thr protein kinase) n=1 Tax=Cryptosporangium aurantiacum TaxID=134849 RepID=A0A1M7PCQ2_9ACTN|nr:ATP-binding protein [Cryptosporangium aurantiacum]SHN14356.1 Anti-sigma regulatory factor (Ser/Thr protein kinase) [Cryptosporangium aurantiacum]